ncbi:MAG TPA: ABC transporter ATP-binding protein [Rhizobiales bacterium]|nr:ABC transporter ATP-binding protein [Hyphomicrobiales bacterium]
MLLEIQDLHAGYGQVSALKGVDITINEGELVALVGANGAGKSTLMQSLSGVHRVSSGKVIFAGREITHLRADRRVRAGISLVPEGRQVFAQMSIEDNLLMGGFTRQAKDIAQGMERAYEMFPVLRERRFQLAGTLSGGEQQMLAIGRALMADPRLLLLDEPSMGLSPLLVDQTFDIIHALSKSGTTIFLVEQNAYMALSIATRGYVMQSGRTLLSGTGQELLEDERVKAAYLGV